MEDAHLTFGPFRLDLANQRLWREGKTVRLPPKAFAVLAYLVQHPGLLVTKQQLFQEVWPDHVVSDAALAVCLSEIRKALGDSPKAPRFIETLHRRGVRFIGKIDPLASSPMATTPQPGTTGGGNRVLVCVGRETEFSQFATWWQQALQGERQAVFVTGEVGIGKTTLVEAFVCSVCSQRPVWIGYGQCSEQYGAGEAYRPILEAFGRLCRQPYGRDLLELFRRHAPTWLAQMPALLNPTEYEALQRWGLGITQERMLREMAELVEVFTAEHPLILVVEDLHWCDAATLSLLALLVRERTPARLLVIGTYRPVEVIISSHPLRLVKQELQSHGYCHELLLDYLSQTAVEAYLRQRFADRAASLPVSDLARFLHRRTEGNPLFMVTLLDSLAHQGLGTRAGTKQQAQPSLRLLSGEPLPTRYKQFVEQYLAYVTVEEQEILDAASVEGPIFCAAAIAAGVGREVDQVEKLCEGLARRHLFLQTGYGYETWPDGTIGSCYGFIHSFYQEVLYSRLPAGRRTKLHRRSGERRELGYGNRSTEVAAQLAVHFEHGQDARRALQYFRQAGENALHRKAYTNAIEMLTKSLILLKTLPDPQDYAAQAPSLCTALRVAVQAQTDLTDRQADQAEHALQLIAEISQQCAETAQTDCSRAERAVSPERYASSP